MGAASVLAGGRCMWEPAFATSERRFLVLRPGYHSWAPFSIPLWLNV